MSIYDRNDRIASLRRMLYLKETATFGSSAMEATGCDDSCSRPSLNLVLVAHTVSFVSDFPSTAPFQRPRVA